MELPEIVTWVRRNFHLGHSSRSKALAEIVWGLLRAGVVSFAAIGRAMVGRAKPASRIARAFRFCHNKSVDPRAIQAALVNALVGRAALSVGRFAQLVLVSMDWHSYDNGEVSGLRVSLITGSRALPLLWYEIKTEDLKGQQSKIEHQALQDLISYRPPGVKWVVLMDVGFHSAALVPPLEEAGFFIMRQSVRMNVHSPNHGWIAIRDLRVRLGQVVEYGWVNWTTKNPTPVRLVVTRLYRGKRLRRGRRGTNRRYKYTDPGLCAVSTNLPIEDFESVRIIRMYARRFEIEHNFRDLKNATYGMDMEHVHLQDVRVYSRLMCIVAVAEAILWLVGAEAESRGLAFNYTTSRPRSGRRVHSVRNVGSFSFQECGASLSRLVWTHLRAALLVATDIVGQSWKEPRTHWELRDQICTRGDLPSLGKWNYKTKRSSPNVWPIRRCVNIAHNADLERRAA